MGSLVEAPERPASRGVPSVILVVALLGALAAAPLVPLVSQDQIVGATVELAAWPPLALVAALVLDRHRRRPLGFICCGLSLVGLLLVGVAALRPSPLTPVALADVIAWFGPWPSVLTVLILLAAFLRPRDRDARRRRAWATLAAVPACLAAIVAWQLLADGRAALVASAAVWLMSAATGAVALSGNLRPVDEPLVDLALVAGVSAAAAGAGLLVRLGGHLSGLARADLLGVFGAVAAAALAVPGALWLRRTQLARRYGSGVLTSNDVAAITADLGGETDPRQLLGKAASMVAVASGSPQVEIQLGEEAEAPTNWEQVPLVVGERRVGTLLVAPRHPDGPEARQMHAVRQLIPTVSLVAQAVTSAVDAQHARQDLARERDAERRRILSDLHDDLGPVLAGLAMRVQARRQIAAEQWLDDLARDLTACRVDLRRIVAGLNPPALEERDLSAALGRLITAYSPGPGSPEVTLVGEVPATLTPPVAATLYRTIAEGLTNAMRHGHASTISVQLDTPGRFLQAEIVDDGHGGPIIDGIGLWSLRRRAEELGGTLKVGPSPSGGTRLSLLLPVHSS